jgi:UDP-N-acetylglucosamine transferase subunit ALG13
VHFAASAGGHLDLLINVAARTIGRERVTWVTSDSQRGRRLRDEQPSVGLLPEHGRSPLSLIRNALAAARLVARTRPRTVVTSGAGVVTPYCLVARIGGARLVYLETMARVTSPSLSARILYRFASRVIVQWEELRTALPRADVCRPTLLEHLGAGEAAAGSGTFVAVGTHVEPYKRLLTLVADAAARGVLPTPVRVQTGAAGGWTAPGIDSDQWLSREEMEAELQNAEVIVCHAGAGTIATALEAGRRPLVLARRPELGEHIDEHQQQLTGKLASWDLVVPLEREINARHVDAARRPLAVPPELEEFPSAAELVAAELPS